ncbi:hypothetical protein BS47DRAFT_1290997, partial [Hydnum rufescens UP504]
DVVYSQPVDQGIGKHANTQFFFILDTLKKRNGPMSLRELSIMTESVLETDPEMLARFEAHENVIKNPINGLYSYRHETFATRDDLLKEIKSHTRRGGGLSVALLKQTWSGAPAVIEELEKEGLVLVTRTGGPSRDANGNKDPIPKMVFWNDIPPTDGGKQVESEFLEMWQSLKWPTEADLPAALDSIGQTPARTSASTGVDGGGGINGKAKGRKGKRGSRARVTKIQNTHLKGIDLTKDYVPPPPSSGFPGTSGSK